MKKDERMIKKEEIRPLYSELQGLLSQAPEAEPPGAGLNAMVSSQILTHYNEIVKNLSRFTGEEHYLRFIVKEEEGYPSVYRSKLSGLISRLHGTYFSDEIPPFSGMPSTVISQTQQQSQSVQVQMLLDFRDIITEKINQLEPEDNKRKFLEKVKGALSSVRDYAGLIALYVTTAQEFGLTLKELLELIK